MLIEGSSITEGIGNSRVTDNLAGTEIEEIDQSQEIREKLETIRSRAAVPG